jgi:hypothetical protein
MVVFGGWDGNVTLDDLGLFDFEQNVWIKFLSIKGSIKGRYRHSAIATDRSMFIFGGID